MRQEADGKGVRPLYTPEKVRKRVTLRSSSSDGDWRDEWLAPQPTRLRPQAQEQKQDHGQNSRLPPPGNAQSTSWPSRSPASDAPSIRQRTRSGPGPGPDPSRLSDQQGGGEWRRDYTYRSNGLGARDQQAYGPDTRGKLEQSHPLLDYDLADRNSTSRFTRPGTQLADEHREVDHYHQYPLHASRDVLDASRRYREIERQDQALGTFLQPQELYNRHQQVCLGTDEPSRSNHHPHGDRLNSGYQVYNDTRTLQSTPPIHGAREHHTHPRRPDSIDAGLSITDNHNLESELQDFWKKSKPPFARIPTFRSSDIHGIAHIYPGANPIIDQLTDVRGWIYTPTPHDQYRPDLELDTTFHVNRDPDREQPYRTVNDSCDQEHRERTGMGDNDLEQISNSQYQQPPIRPRLPLEYPYPQPHPHIHQTPQMGTTYFRPPSSVSGSLRQSISALPPITEEEEQDRETEMEMEEYGTTTGEWKSLWASKAYR